MAAEVISWCIFVGMVAPVIDGPLPVGDIVAIGVVVGSIAVTISSDIDMPTTDSFFSIYFQQVNSAQVIAGMNHDLQSSATIHESKKHPAQPLLPPLAGRHKQTRENYTKAKNKDNWVLMNNRRDGKPRPKKNILQGVIIDQNLNGNKKLKQHGKKF